MIRWFLRNLAEGPIAPQLRKFVVVGALAAGIQLVLLWLFVEYLDLSYLVGAVVAIEITIILNYVLNNAWTFRSARNTGLREYLWGLGKTNVVRGTAIPIQVAFLYLLVEVGGLPYLVANGGAIAISGIYRYVFDARWTWGA